MGMAAGIQADLAAGGALNPSVSLVRDPPIGDVFPLSQGSREVFHEASGYVQDEWDVTDDLRLVPGARFDYHSRFGSVNSPRLAMLYTMTPASRVRASAGRAFRAPSLSELFGNVVFHGTTPGFPNPDLDPEYITSFDGGLQYEVGRGLRTEMNVFYNDMTNLIQLVISPSRDHFDWVNVADARSTGHRTGCPGRPRRLVRLLHELHPHRQRRPGHRRSPRAGSPAQGECGPSVQRIARFVAGHRVARSPMGGRTVPDLPREAGGTGGLTTAPISGFPYARATGCASESTS